MASLEDEIHKLLHNFLANGSYSDKTVQDVISLLITSAKMLTSCYNKQLKEQKSENFLIVPNFLEKLTIHKLKSKLKKKNGLHYIEAQKIVLGKRHDIRLVEGEQEVTVVEDPLYYFSIKSIILSVLSDKEKFFTALNEKKTGNGIIAKDIDGQQLQHLAPPHESDGITKIVLRLVLWADAFESANPLGSKSSAHKITNFCIFFMNFGSPSKQSDIYTLQICYSDDIKKYGIQTVMQQFCIEMKELITGIHVNLHGYDVLVQTRLAGITGDNLEMHELLEYVPPQSSKFCRCCDIERKQFKTCPCKIGTLKTKESYESLKILLEHETDESTRLEILKSAGYESVQNVFNTVDPDFHIQTNWIFDLLHDKFEGETKIIAKSILNYCIYQIKIISLDEFNNRLKNFQYGERFVKDKPTVIDETNLRNLQSQNFRQYGLQMWLFIRVLPFLIYDKLIDFKENKQEAFFRKLEQKKKMGKTEKQIPKAEEVMELLGLQLQILRIATSPQVTEGTICLLDSLTKQQCLLFSQIFPYSSLLNKFHYGLHHSESMRQKGPLILWWTPRLESKHQLLKKRANSAGNFKNLPKTLTDQVSWSYSFDKMYPEPTEIFKLIMFVQIERDKSCFQSLKSSETTVCECDHLIYKGIAYRSGNFLCYHCDGAPNFAKIIKMAKVENDLLFKLQVFECSGFDDFFCAYQIRLAEEDNLLEISFDKCFCTTPLPAWTTFSTNLDDQKLFVSTRTLEF